MARFYNKKIPTSYTEALRMCKDHALAKLNLSVEGIADLMGVSASRLYQHLDSGEMPFNRVRNFQRICGCNYVTQYLAHGDDCMIVEIPTGKKLSQSDFIKLQSSFTDVLSTLTKFCQDPNAAEEAINAINNHIAHTAWHKSNIEKNKQPDLMFGEQE